VFRSACISGTCALHVFVNDDEEIDIEVVKQGELAVDDFDGQYGAPQSIYKKRLVDRDRLAARFPEMAEEIFQSSARTNLPNETVERCFVVESWHLPSSKKAKNGCHALSINGADLLVEPYTKDYFPILPFNWNNREVGFFGQGMASELEMLQLYISRTINNIHEAQDLVAKPRVWIEAGSNVAASNINNKIGEINKFTGSIPTFQTPTAMQPEMYNHLSFLWSKCFETIGLSQLSASSQIPAGLKSGAAMRAYQAVQSTRFANVSKRWEQWFIKIAMVMVDLSKDLYSNNKSLSAKTISKKKVSNKTKTFVETIKWSDVAMKEDEYEIQCFPTSMLPKSPEAKLDAVQEIIQSGLVPPDEALDLLDWPDFEGFMSRKASALNNINRILEDIIANKRYTPPNNYMNVKLAQVRANEELQQGEIDGVPEDRLDLLRQFINDCSALITSANAPPPAPPGSGAPVGQALPPPPAPLAPQGSGAVAMGGNG
jgi:hypothetical protein